MGDTAYARRTEDGMYLSRQQVEDYILRLEEKGLTGESISDYQSRLYRFLDLLPDGQHVRPETLGQIQDDMLKAGFSAGTVNGFTTVVNGLLDFCGHRELQASRVPNDGQKDVPRLSREEYLRLLSAARTQKRERTYLQIKTIASAGLMIEELQDVTVEAVREGCIENPRRCVALPDFLCRELLDYASRKRISTGRIFCTRRGRPIDRSNLNHDIKALSKDAHVPAEKCTPRCLRKMYQRTQQKIRDDVETLVEQELARIMEKEQAVIGWDA